MRLEKNIFGKYKVNKRDSDSYILMAIGLSALVLSFWFFITTEQNWDSVVWRRTHEILSDILKFSNTTGSQFIEIVVSLVNTILISISVTILTIFIGIPISIFAAKNLYAGPISTTARTIASIFRSIPTVVWVYIFIPVFGLSLTTAFVGMLFHSLAFFIKAFSESYEEVDPGITEALTATGANKLKIGYSAIIPASYKKIVGWVLLRLETNLRVVIVIAPAVGVTGSVGSLVFTYYNGGLYGQLGLTLALIILSALALEKISSKITSKL